MLRSYGDGIDGNGLIVLGTMYNGDDTHDKLGDKNYVVNNLWDINVVTWIIVKLIGVSYLIGLGFSGLCVRCYLGSG